LLLTVPRFHFVRQSSMLARWGYIVCCSPMPNQFGQLEQGQKSRVSVARQSARMLFADTTLSLTERKTISLCSSKRIIRNLKQTLSVNIRTMLAWRSWMRSTDLYNCVAPWKHSVSPSLASRYKEYKNISLFQMSYDHTKTLSKCRERRIRWRNHNLLFLVLHVTLCCLWTLTPKKWKRNIP
jgi:hypothetical protein